MADRRGPSWLRLTEKARRELILADPPPVLLELAIQVDAHVPLRRTDGGVWCRTEEDESCPA